MQWRQLSFGIILIFVVLLCFLQNSTSQVVSIEQLECLGDSITLNGYQDTVRLRTTVDCEIINSSFTTHQELEVFYKDGKLITIKVLDN